MVITTILNQLGYDNHIEPLWLLQLYFSSTICTFSTTHPTSNSFYFAGEYFDFHQCCKFKGGGRCICRQRHTYPVLVFTMPLNIYKASYVFGVAACQSRLPRGVRRSSPPPPPPRAKLSMRSQLCCWRHAITHTHT